MPTKEELLDQLMAIDEEENPGNRLSIHEMVNAHRRKRTHSRIRENSPKLDLHHHLGQHHDKMAEKLKAFIRAELTDHDHDAGAGAMDDLLLIAQDAIEGGKIEEILHALIAVYRKVWAWTPHMGNIDPHAVIEDKTK